MTQELFRPLSDYEQAVITRLFEVEFPGREELKDQVSHAEASLIPATGDNYGSINIRTSSDRRAVVENRVPVISMTKDEGGAHVEILLHVIDGKINELEFVRMDGAPMVGLPRLDLMQLHVRGANTDQQTIKYLE
jgi:hypothetical protein